MTETSSARRLLLPLVPLYRLALGGRELRLRTGWEPVRRLRYPVISVGNLSTGGSGKTPMSIALVQLLTTRGFRLDVLSRGYGRRSAVPLRVDPNGSPVQFGDEPLLIARQSGVPVYVAAHRYDAGLVAEAEIEAELGQNAGQARVAHILDDGFQHRQLARDIDILLVNRANWHDRLLPAGNLREAHRASYRADLVAVPADDPAFESELRAWGWKGPIWRLHRRIEIPPVSGRVAAFCGIARPGQFFDGLIAGGLRLVSLTAFPDHHRYTERDLQTLHQKARAAGATALVTTEKDILRLPSLIDSFPASMPLIPVPLRIEIEDEAGALEWLTARLSGGVGQCAAVRK